MLCQQSLRYMPVRESCRGRCAGAAPLSLAVTINMHAAKGHMNKEDAQEWEAPGTALNGPPAPTHHAAPPKRIVTIRLDADMLEWFKDGGPGYQTRINQILRQHMDGHRDDGVQPD